MGKSRHAKRHTGKNKARTQGIARIEDAVVRKKSAVVGGISNLRKPRPDDPVFTPAEIDNHIKGVRKFRELTTDRHVVMAMPVDEIAWRQANGLMPKDTSDGNIPAVPFLTTKSVIYKHANRLIPPYVEGNKMLGNPPQPRVTPKNLLSKDQKAAYMERAKRYGNLKD